MVDLQVATLAGKDTLIDETAVNAFKTSLRGDLLRAGDDGYDEARTVYNAMIDKRPGLIVRCAGVADVINSVNLARANDLLLAVRGGGHSIAGKSVCDGGIVVDLSRMNGVRVDPVNHTARAEGGAKWGQFDYETQALGLATTGGVDPDTGIAGLTLSGGLGWLMRNHGLSCDNLLSADLVTAEGKLLTANATQNAELFWGLRGGGGNFGVVTSFEFQLHPVGPMVLAGMVLHPLEKAKEVLKFYRDFTANAPDEITAHVGMLTAPDGNLAIGIVACYSGAIETGERLVQPLREFGPPVLDVLQPMPYRQMQTFFEAAFPSGLHNYWKSNYMTELSNDAIETMVARYASVPSAQTFGLIEHVGGAIGRVGADETAFNHRDAQYNFSIFSLWSNPAKSDKNVTWTRDFLEAMQPFCTEALYANYMSEDDSEDRNIAAYGGPEKYKRLVALKNKYDPTNLFRLNQNIRPTV